MVCACQGRKLYKDMKTLKWSYSNYNKSYALTLSQVKKCKKPTPTLLCVECKSNQEPSFTCKLCFLMFSHYSKYYAMLATWVLLGEEVLFLYKVSSSSQSASIPVALSTFEGVWGLGIEAPFESSLAHEITHIHAAKGLGVSATRCIVMISFCWKE